MSEINAGEGGVMVWKPCVALSACCLAFFLSGCASTQGSASLGSMGPEAVAATAPKGVGARGAIDILGPLNAQTKEQLSPLDEADRVLLNPDLDPNDIPDVVDEWILTQYPDELRRRLASGVARGLGLSFRQVAGHPKFFNPDLQAWSAAIDCRVQSDMDFRQRRIEKGLPAHPTSTAHRMAYLVNQIHRYASCPAI